MTGLPEDLFVEVKTRDGSHDKPDTEIPFIPHVGKGSSPAVLRAAAAAETPFFSQCAGHSFTAAVTLLHFSYYWLCAALIVLAIVGHFMKLQQQSGDIFQGLVVQPAILMVVFYLLRWLFTFAGYAFWLPYQEYVAVAHLAGQCSEFWGWTYLIWSPLVLGLRYSFIVAFFVGGIVLLLLAHSGALDTVVKDPKVQFALAIAVTVAFILNMFIST